MAATTEIQLPEAIEEYHAYNAAAALFEFEGSEVILSGPAGTGKSRACLEKVNWTAQNWPGMRALMVRKTLSSLKETGLVTFDEKVRPDLMGAVFRGEAKRPPRYVYPNGSTVAIGGLDKATKVMSSEYDLIYVQEATEISEAEWEALSTRLRNGVMPYQQIFGDVNPDAPTHWIKQRANREQLLLLWSQHTDNPVLWDRERQQWTPDGARYIAKLDALTGVRKARLRHGRWVAAEGMVYEGCWNPELNLVDRARISRRPTTLYGNCGIDPSWTRYMSVDFGFTNPFVCRWYAEDPDGRLWMYREIYHTRKIVEDHARDIRRVARWGESDGDPLPYAVICDHDAEDRHTLERHLGLRRPTVAAYKDVSTGIQAMAARLRPAGDKHPRLVYLRNSLVARDPELVDSKRPTCGAEEIESYVWEIRAGGKYGEAPVKENDHAMDADRYMCAYKDLKPRTVLHGPRLI